MSDVKPYQWPCIQQNIGTWHGAFVEFSPEGQQVKETPSVLTLKETEPGKTMQLTLERTPPGGTTNVVQQSFHHPGPAPYVLFFESGAFSQGTPQWSSFGQFGAEFSLKVGDRRVRYVVMYESTQHYTSKIKYVTLICETQTGSTEFTESVPTEKSFMGDWSGTANVLHATMAPPTTGTSQWQLSRAQNNDLTLTCSEQLEGGLESLELVSDRQSPLSSATCLVLKGREEKAITYQLMLLPKGAYCLLPQEIQKETEFRIEVGWLGANGSRERLIRYYDTRGSWMKSALLSDRAA